MTHHSRARAACAYWRAAEEGGCDQPILLGKLSEICELELMEGNDELYGGLGGEFTSVKRQVLRAVS